MAVTCLLGCPYESPIALDESPQLNIDENLIGNWEALVLKPSYDQYPVKEKVGISFSRRNNVEYDFAISGNIHELSPYTCFAHDTIRGTAFISDISGFTFLNIRIRERVFIAELKNENGHYSIMALAEHFTSVFARKSKDLRAAVCLHYKINPHPFYDEFFVLKDLQKID